MAKAQIGDSIDQRKSQLECAALTSHQNIFLKSGAARIEEQRNYDRLVAELNDLAAETLPTMIVDGQEWVPTAKGFVLGDYTITKLNRWLLTADGVFEYYDTAEEAAWRVVEFGLYEEGRQSEHEQKEVA
jgi:hypothetical protein